MVAPCMGSVNDSIVYGFRTVLTIPSTLTDLCHIFVLAFDLFLFATKIYEIFYMAIEKGGKVKKRLFLHFFCNIKRRVFLLLKKLFTILYYQKFLNINFTLDFDFQT